MNMNDFVKERDYALTQAVMEDDFEPILAYFIKYDVPIMSTKSTNNLRVIQGAAYKAAYNCLSLPQNVRERAKQKCIEIGMSEKII